MIRLVILTLLVLFGALSLFGEPGARRSVPSPSASTTNGDDERKQASPPVIDDPVPGAEIVPASLQTPEQVPRYPGPKLQPSPEYAGQAEVTEPQIVAAEGANVMYVSGNRVNFRQGPSTGDAVIGALSLGSPVEVLGPENEGWVNIRDAEGRVGYMSGQFISADEPR